MLFLSDVMCESAAESPWLPEWILVEKQLQIWWISFQRQQSPAARTARVQTHLIPHNYTAGLKCRIDARVCSGAVEDFPECKGLIEVVCLRRIDLTTTNQYKGGRSASVAVPLLDGSACPVHSCSWIFLNYWKTQFFKLHPAEMRNTSPDENCISAASIIYSQVVEHLSKPLGLLFLTYALGVISGRLNFQL